MERSSQEDAWEEQASRSGGVGEAGDSAGTKLETESDTDHKRPSLRVPRPQGASRVSSRAEPGSHQHF